MNNPSLPFILENAPDARALSVNAAAPALTAEGIEFSQAIDGVSGIDLPIISPDDAATTIDVDVLDPDTTDAEIVTEANDLQAMMESWYGVSSAVPRPIRVESQGPVLSPVERLPTEPELVATTLETGRIGTADTVGIDLPDTGLMIDWTAPQGVAIDMLVESSYPDLTLDLGPRGSAIHSRDLPATPDWRPAQPTASSVVRQIGDAVVTTRDDKIEIALSPEELGRVRIVLSGREHAPHVVVWAERPEVMDQLRRNSALLLQHFGESGLQDASFEFRDDGFDRKGDDSQPTRIMGVSDGPIPAPIMLQPIIAASWAGGPRIDIRM